MDESEKRQTNRRFWNGAVEIYDMEGLLLIGIGRLLNLSETGSLIESALPFPPGEVLRLRLRMGDPQPIELRVTIVRVQRQRSPMIYGIRFTAVMPEELARLQKRLQNASL